MFFSGRIPEFTFVIAMSILAQAYLPVVRAAGRTFAKDPQALRQVVGAIRNSVWEMQRQNFSDQQIVEELEQTKSFLRENLAQVAYNPEIDSYTVKLTQAHVPDKPGVVVDIKTPRDLLEEQNTSLDDVVGRFSNKNG